MTRPRDSEQLRYKPSPEYAYMVHHSNVENTPIGPDWFAQKDIECPSLNGRMVEARFNTAGYLFNAHLR